MDKHIRYTSFSAVSIPERDFYCIIAPTSHTVSSAYKCLGEEMWPKQLDLQGTKNWILHDDNGPCHSMTLSVTNDHAYS